VCPIIVFAVLDLFTRILSNPATYTALIIEFVLGLAFGYYFRKLITALLGLMILGFIGVALNYAQFMMLKDVLVEHLDIGAGTLMDVIGLITIVLGLTVLAPLTIGLIIGYLIGR
jgi:hypothetical protein